MSEKVRMGEVSAERLARDIEAIASFSECAPTQGYSRPTFSEPWRRARDYVMEQARAAGCRVWVDAAGNVHARPEEVGPGERVWLSGSHIDSVPTGGKYDGVVGVVAALEVLRVKRAVPMELVIFAEEEGTTFNLGMLGSRAWVGTLTAEQLKGLRNKQGQNYLEAGAGMGVSEAGLEGARLEAAAYRGFIELHVEQGVSMWNAGVPVAVVRAINGRRQYECTLKGEANHAGSTKMGDRRDALAAAAEMVVAMERLGRGMQEEMDHTVLTVGRMVIEPNALNVIAGGVRFHVDFRAATDAMLERGDGVIQAEIEGIARRRGVGCEWKMTERLKASPMEERVRGRLHAAAVRETGRDVPEVMSGALHDAAILAPLLPTAMVFVASEGGISHNPAEFSRIEDIALATRILAGAVSA